MADAEFAPNSSKKGLNIYGDCNQKDPDLDRIAEADELFDAVLTGSVNQEKNVAKKMAIAKDASKEEKPKRTPVRNLRRGSAKRKLSLYIGNFPWWTSDSDLVCMAQRLGVSDVTDVKFAENRVNGQSRGYAEVSVTSEESLKSLLEKVPGCNLNGETVDCRFATHQNLSIFEEKASQRIPLRVHSKDSPDSEISETFSPLPQEQYAPPLPPHLPTHTSSFPNLFLRHPPPFYPSVPPSIPPPLLPPHFPPPQLHALSQPPSSHLPINQAMFTPGRDVRSGISYSQQRHNQCNNNADFEELMNRNRAVTSTAITKAVSSATTGDLQIATETLLTAIAIIKQSRVYEDECCQALVTSLKDCLVSIQGNYVDRSSSRSRYEERSRDREQERDWNRDREDPYGWESAGTSRRHRDCSWSRDRDKDWPRSRDRERHRDRHR